MEGSKVDACAWTGSGYQLDPFRTVYADLQQSPCRRTCLTSWRLKAQPFAVAVHMWSPDKRSASCSSLEEARRGLLAHVA